MNMVNLKINNIPVSVPEGTTIVEAARSANIEIPTLCYLKDLNAIGSCRVCVVEIKGARSLAAACVYPVSEGMEVSTNTPTVRKSRKTTLELILSNHEKKCLSCIRSQSCELQRLSLEYGCEDTKYEGENTKYDIDDSSLSIVRDNNKCILCRRCVAACNNTQAVSVIGPNQRGFRTEIACAFESPLGDVSVCKLATVYRCMSCRCIV
jgi:NADP-reducing hydrogenase subunit HndD